MPTDQPFRHMVTGIVLAGGRSSRFGANKALVELRGKPLIQHSIDVLTALFRHCLIIANEPDDYQRFGLPIVPDRFPGQGPLSGIHAGLNRMTTDWAFVTACDMPLLHPGMIRFLWSFTAHRQDLDVILPCSERGPEPLYGFYHHQGLPMLQRHLEAGNNRLQQVLAALRLRQVTATEWPLALRRTVSFRNINRPEDLAALSTPSRSPENSHT